jgi:HD-like signal output (HDOD) protein
MLNRESIYRRMRHVPELRTMPAVVKRLFEMLDDPRLSVDDIAACVSNDQVLAAHLLKLANSPFFGFCSRVTSIQQALVLLGVNMAKAFLLGVSLFRHVRGLGGLWHHSVGTAIVTGVITQRQAIKEQGECFVAGLLHDIGKVFLLMKFPDAYQHVLALVKEKAVLIVDAEMEIFNCTHAEIGSWVLERWSLPCQLVEAIRYHHQPSLADKWFTETALVHVADALIRTRGFGSGGDVLVPLIDGTVSTRLGLSEIEIAAILSDSEDLLREAEGFLSYE